MHERWAGGLRRGESVCTVRQVSLKVDDREWDAARCVDGCVDAFAACEIVLYSSFSAILM